MLRSAVLSCLGAAALAVGVFVPRRIEAALGDCGEPAAAGPVAVDALEVLNTAIGGSDCGGFDPCICDVNSAGGVTAGDALTVLRKAVGQNVELNCTCGATTTVAPTTSTLTTTTTTVTTTSTLPLALDTKELVLLAKTAGTYSLSDLPGTWELNVLATGPGSPLWGRGSIVIASDGSFSGTLRTPDGSSTPLSGNLVISADGIVTCTNGCDPAFAGAVDSRKTAFVASNTDKHGTGLLYVGTRKGSGYTKADLAGTWRLENLVSGPDTGRWSLGTVTIDANGAVSIDSVDSDGSLHTVDEVYSIDADGVITCSDGCRPDFRGVLDSGKNIIVATSTNPDNLAKLNVLTRQVAPYAQADLAGNWAWTTFDAGPDLPPLWARGAVTIATGGGLSGTLTDSEGAQMPVTGTLTIDPNGVITSSADARLRCSIDADRTMIACIDSR